MEAGRRFHDLAAAVGNERSPRVDRCVGGMVSNIYLFDLLMAYLELCGCLHKESWLI